MNQASTLHKIMAHTHTQLESSMFKQPRVLAIASGKGGVGKTNITTNLAYSLAKKGQKVLVLDADLNLANVDILLGLTPEYNLHHVFLGQKRLQDILIDGPGGFQLLPASSGIMEMSELTEDQKLYFLSEVSELGHDIDIMLIDTAAGINKNVIYFTLASQEKIIVLTPEPTSLTDAYALIKVLSSQHDVRRFRILVNNAHSEKEALAVYRQLTMVADRFLDSLSLDYLGFLPFDQKLSQAVRAQRLVVDLSPTAEISGTFAKLAEQIINEDIDQHNDGNIKFFWKGLFNL
jgi:flagellar biosynthesis protein FlhG